MKGFLPRLLPYILSFFSSLCIMVLELVASRLVARHVGGSLIVWTSVIGIMLGGICLGNVLGGRLADRVEPRAAIGPLYALGALLTLGCLWMNAVVGLTPGLKVMPWNLRTVLVVTLDFLIPGTVLGMISPVVAKMAVEQARKSGSALGDVYMLGAVGSIVGTFVAGFYLIYLAPTSTIVTLIAAAYALLAAALLEHPGARVLGLGSALALGVGGALSAVHQRGAVPGIPLPAMSALIRDPQNLAAQVLCLAGNVLALLLAILALARLRSLSRPIAPDASEYFGTGMLDDAKARTGLGDLATLAFIASLAFMALEMVAGRLVQRHTGSSVYGWTSVIGILLGGLSLGNYLGGKIGDFVRSEKQASWLFLAASILTLWVLLTESPPPWLVRNPIEHFVHGRPGEPLAGGSGEFLHQALNMAGYPWWFRVLFWTGVVFFVPAISMGTVSPVVAKLAVERLRQAKRTGTAIGQVYAWGMVGSILGTFLTGFLLIDVLGTKGVLLLLATILALAAFILGTVWHALWAGIPLGLCVIAFLPLSFLERQSQAWGIREEKGNPATAEDGGLAWTDESNYYFIKVTHSLERGRAKRTLVLDNLIHGYIVLNHPEQLDYDYEHIYALVTRRLMERRQQDGKRTLDPTAPAGTPLSVLFLGGGSYTFPRFLQRYYPGTMSDIAEIDPAVTRANHMATALPEPLAPGQPASGPVIHTVWGDARQFVEKRHRGRKKYDIVFGDAFNDFSVPWHLTTRQFNEMISEMLTEDGIFMINIIDIYRSDKQAREDAQEEREWIEEQKQRTETRETYGRTRRVPPDPDRAVEQAHQEGGFLSSWVETARLTFPNVYVFGTNSGYKIDPETGQMSEKSPGRGLRETFVVVAAKKPIDLQRLRLAELGGMYADPHFDQEIKVFAPYSQEHLDALKVRAHGIILTDDYAPVENLLAPVAATRGHDD